jgi:hypothetical protein
MQKMKILSRIKNGTGRVNNIATFVNAEGPQYLVIEDKFANGRPAYHDFNIVLARLYAKNHRIEKAKHKYLECLKNINNV